MEVRDMEDLRGARARANENLHSLLKSVVRQHFLFQLVLLYKDTE